MDGRLIEKLLLERDDYGLVKAIFAGSYSADTLPHDLKPGYIYLLNESKLSELGSHWVILRRLREREEEEGRRDVNDNDDYDGNHRGFASEFLCWYGSGPSHLPHVYNVMKKYGEIYSFGRRLQTIWVREYMCDSSRTPMPFTRQGCYYFCLFCPFLPLVYKLWFILLLLWLPNCSRI